MIFLGAVKHVVRGAPSQTFLFVCLFSENTLCGGENDLDVGESTKLNRLRYPINNLVKYKTENQFDLKV